MSSGGYPPETLEDSEEWCLFSRETEASRNAIRGGVNSVTPTMAERCQSGDWRQDSLLEIWRNDDTVIVRGDYTCKYLNQWQLGFAHDTANKIAFWS